ncbi:hypothetical protein SARC_01251 [Sphaeroforma arctica JP610]|uniref:Uncharacterized protein n=1 Tax=Sphaeroforma arctica JP610 TaxID=667725 RepID=A0A0L0GCA0_9EUKA|nr:hypothetical protein SARC_01251 [Sphaeroforma arctica JP610]KNC86622.1 hypothetical protein SARC_01251 [Sphaeroforma arctica JP610]|eukprot:XP_014160524.1 hypothetical protein SARC_01251 [Sphaeroforma arctica JP610]
MFEVLQKLIVFMCRRALLVVLISEVEAWDDNPVASVASAADHMAAIQKRLTAYQAEAPVVDLNRFKEPQPSAGRVGSLAKAVSETGEAAPEPQGPKKRGPKSAPEKRKNVRRAARAAKTVEVA